jgi:putative peptide zinc metalloprotease protein
MALTAELERRKMVRLRARPDLVITPQKYEGKTCYVVKDPVSLRYYRFNDQENFVFSQFNGENTLDKTQKDFEKEFRPHRLTLEDLESFAQQLLQAGLVQHETPMSGKELYDKRRKQRRMQKIATWTNILYIKIPVFDPDRLLTRMLKYTSWIFTWWFFAASVLLMLSAIALVVTHFDTFWARLPNYQWFFHWNRLLYIWIALGIVKVIHEFGHGLSCKAFGGECHEMGALFLCLSPCLYCNVSDSWTIPNKWKRIAISFAGIYVELVIAAIATWVWWYTPHSPVVNNIALCVMVLCSISTVVFNANPLMRFDGYYIMADWLEIPNLRDRSNRLLKNWWCETCLGIEVPPEPYMEPTRQILFIAYAVVAYLYRWIITFSILYFLANWLKPYNLAALSGLLAVFALGSMLIWPCYRMGKNYFRRGRMPDMKRNRVAITSTVIATIVALFFLLPLPISRIREVGLVQIDREVLSEGKVTVPDQAIPTKLHVRNGQKVYEGQLLAECVSPKLLELRADAEQMREQYLAEATAAAQQLLVLSDPDEKKRIESERVHARNKAEEQTNRLRLIDNQIAALRELRAPCDGIVMQAPTREEWSKPVDKEQPQPFCLVCDTKKLQVLVPVSSDDYHLLQQDIRGMKHLPVTIYIPGRGTNYAYGKVVRLPEQDAKDVPPQLTHPTGGPLAVRPSQDQQKHVPQAQVYLVEIELDQPDPYLVPGTRVKVKIHCQWRTSAWWVWRKLSSLFDIGLI